MDKHYHLCANWKCRRLFLCNLPDCKPLDDKLCPPCLDAEAKKQTAGLDRYLEQRGGCYDELGDSDE